MVAVIFDGTTQVGEVFVVVLRFLLKKPDGAVYLQQRIVTLARYVKTFDAVECAAVLAQSLNSFLATFSSNVLSFSADRCSVNISALGVIQQLYRSSVFLPCVPHGLDNTGKRLWSELKVLPDVISCLSNIKSRSNAAAGVFRNRFGCALKSYSKTR